MNMMKNFRNIITVIITLALAGACTDYEKLDYKVSEPANLAIMDMLNQYNDLKTYVDRAANPNFKLGAGVVFSDYTSKGVIYRMINRNFDEIADGYTMKHAAVVQADGSLDLSNVYTLLQTAKDAGVTVYGHTLCWHANQNAKYLNSLIAPNIIPGTGGPTLFPSVITNSDFESGSDSGWNSWGNSSTRGITANGDGYDGGYALMFTNPSSTNSWSAQVAYDFPTPLAVGETYQLDFKVKATGTASVSAGMQNPSDYSDRGSFGSFDLTTEWQEVKLHTVISGEDASRFLFNFGAFAGTIYLDDVTLCQVNPSGGTSSGSTMLNDFEADALGTAYPMTVPANGTATVVADPDDSGNKVLSIGNAATPANQSEPVFDIKLPPGIKLGDCTYLVLDIYVVNNQGIYGQGLRMTVNGKEGTVGDNFAVLGAQNNAWGRNLRVPMSMVPLSDADKTLTEFTLSFGNRTGAGFYYYDNMRMEWQTTGDLSVEKTPEEKALIIDSALEAWIGGMVTNCKDYVKAWDIVNEPMDDGNPSQLKTGVGKTLASDEFYWQDYLGKDYAVRAIQLERKYGNPDDKLFINDYNLEYNPAKCTGLINYVKYVEDQGVKVDGIGTQMHVTIASDTAKIVQMFQLLAATGKLIKVSELDMGLGGVMTANATDSMYIAQANLYEFIVKKYFEIIPPAQRYGITMWAPQDSPANSSWRAGEPIGLWTLDLNRKRAYGGYANGLAGRDVSADFK